MTRKEYEERLSELDAKFYDDDTSYEECEEIARIAEELHARYSHYDEEILKETLDILKGAQLYVPTKKRNRIKFI